MAIVLHFEVFFLLKSVCFTASKKCGDKKISTRHIPKDRSKEHFFFRPDKKFNREKKNIYRFAMYRKRNDWGLTNNNRIVEKLNKEESAEEAAATQKNVRVFSSAKWNWLAAIFDYFAHKSLVQLPEFSLLLGFRYFPSCFFLAGGFSWPLNFHAFYIHHFFQMYFNFIRNPKQHSWFDSLGLLIKSVQFPKNQRKRLYRLFSFHFIQN